eukprot:SM000193S05173  [mRNA]  locus=s193:145509:147781:+ [translate_table: standard]
MALPAATTAAVAARPPPWRLGAPPAASCLPCVPLTRPWPRGGSRLELARLRHGGRCGIGEPVASRQTKCLARRSAQRPRAAGDDAAERASDAAQVEVAEHPEPREAEGNSEAHEVPRLPSRAATTRERPLPRVLRQWDVPFVGTGVASALVVANLGLGRRNTWGPDEQALFILGHQILQTSLGLAAIFYITRAYRPLPDDVLSFRSSAPLNLRSGYILWSAIGIILAFVLVQATAAASSTLAGQPPPREDADALMQLLPIIGASPVSTLSLIAVTGVCAPILEETIFRGFLLVSLTKWLPTPAAITISAVAFAGAHLTPGEFPQLTALGLVLGIVYAQTRTLLTPMLVHAMWNSGVIVILTILRLEGYNIQELL